MNRLPYLLIALSLAGTSVAFAQTPAKTPTGEAVFAAWDTNKNQSLSLEEFRAGADRIAQVAALRQLKGNFDRVNRNHDSALDAGEFATLPVVKQGGASAPALATTDADRNGRVEFKEYVAMVSALAKSPTPKP